MRLFESIKNVIASYVHAPVRGAVGVCDEWCRAWRFYDRVLPTAFLFGVLGFLIYYVTLMPPAQFPGATLMKISNTKSVRDVAVDLKNQHLIRSVWVFEAFAYVYGAKTHVAGGEYFFPTAQNVVEISKRLARGDYELVPVKVTIPEGLNVYQVSKILDRSIVDFDVQEFINEAQTKEGYLFPDTYYFLPGEAPKDVIATLEENFKRRVLEGASAATLQAAGHSLTDLVTMGSLLEKEASNTHDRQMIADILWRRIAIGMPLQVDAVFPLHHR